MTNMPPVVETVLIKTDAKGRVATPPERREQLLDEFERSGLSGAEFARLVGVKYPTFATWAARRRRQRALAQAPDKVPPRVRWLEAVVSEAKSAAGNLVSPLRVRLSAGACIELTELTQVNLAAALVQALEKPPVAC